MTIKAILGKVMDLKMQGFYFNRTTSLWVKMTLAVLVLKVWFLGSSDLHNVWRERVEGWVALIVYRWESLKVNIVNQSCGTKDTTGSSTPFQTYILFVTIIFINIASHSTNPKNMKHPASFKVTEEGVQKVSTTFKKNF